MLFLLFFFVFICSPRPLETKFCDDEIFSDIFDLNIQTSCMADYAMTPIAMLIDVYTPYVHVGTGGASGTVEIQITNCIIILCKSFLNLILMGKSMVLKTPYCEQHTRIVAWTFNKDYFWFASTNRSCFQFTIHTRLERSHRLVIYVWMKGYPVCCLNENLCKKNNVLINSFQTKWNGISVL